MKTQEIKDFFDAAQPVDEGSVHVSVNGRAGKVIKIYGISYNASNGRVVFETKPYPKSARKKKAVKKVAKKKARKKT